MIDILSGLEVMAVPAFRELAVESTPPGERLRDSKLPIVIPFAHCEVYKPPVIYYNYL